MRIEQIKINGIAEPVGFSMDGVTVTWKVRESVSEKPAGILVEVSGDCSFESILCRAQKTGEEEFGVFLPGGAEFSFALSPRTRYYVRIRVEGDKGDSAQAVTFFETGKMDEPWRAFWIAAAKEDTFHPEFAKTFTVKKGVQSARLYISGAGLFEAYLNDEKIGKEFLTPYLNHYEKGLQAITFPVEGLKEDAENSLTIDCGKGWYMSTFGLKLEDKNFGDRMAAIAELHIRYEDGTEDIIGTDQSWKVRGSLTEDSGIYDGEIINRLLYENRDNPWKSVCVLEHPEEDEGTKNLAFPLRDRLSLPVVVKEILPVREVIHTPAGETVLDFGQNFAGFPEFTAQLPKGTHVKLEFGEILQQGNFYHKNYRDAKSELHYISDGTLQTVRPRFTFFGFRYVKVSGWPEDQDYSCFTGCVLYSDLTRTGYIETGNEKINRLYQNTVWSMKSNFIDIPTDCPQRSERLGWTGDAQIFAPTATYHMDTLAFFHKFFHNLRDEQEYTDGAVPNTFPNFGHDPSATAIWGDIASFVPWKLYGYYGNTGELARAYPMMKDWCDWVDRLVAANGGRPDPEDERGYLWDFGFQFGDWVALDGATPMSYKGGTDDGYLASMYFLRTAQIISEAAGVLGLSEDKEKYGALSEKIRESILKEYFTPTGRLAIDSQTGILTALQFNVCPDKGKLISQLMQRFGKDMFRIKCGFAGAPQMCTIFAREGLTDLAYDFLFNEDFPGWLYEVNLGATTIWERWNSVQEDGTIADNEMNSLNHYSYGSVSEFLYSYALGIRSAAPGFTKAVIGPNPDVRLGKLSGSYDSVSGRYQCSWEIAESGELCIRVSIPFGCEADVILPADPENRRPHLPAGEYEWTYMPTVSYRKPYGWNTKLSRIAKDPAAMAVLAKYVPAVAGMASDPERAAMTLTDMKFMGFLPIDPAALAKAAEELEQVTV